MERNEVFDELVYVNSMFELQSDWILMSRPVSREDAIKILIRLFAESKTVNLEKVDSKLKDYDSEWNCDNDEFIVAISKKYDDSKLSVEVTTPADPDSHAWSHRITKKELAQLTERNSYDSEDEYDEIYMSVFVANYIRLLAREL